MPSCERTIKVVGPHLAGKKTLMGAMLYMCGLDLSKLEQLQKDGIHEYDKIIGYYQEKGIAPVFSAKTGTMRFSDSPQTDGVVYVLDAAGSNEAIFNSGQSFADPDRETFKVAGSLILAINKMDTVNWSRERYEQLVIPTIQQLKSIGVSPEKYAVPYLYQMYSKLIL
ncbi:hypothetical protein SLS57_005270 [Botryosphaeria dothidea]